MLPGDSRRITVYGMAGRLDQDDLNPLATLTGGKPL
jgi:hypothetical protein